MLKRIYETLGSRLTRRTRANPAPLELHKLPWHPVFYKTLKVHIENTTPTRRP